MRDIERMAGSEWVSKNWMSAKEEEWALGEKKNIRRQINLSTEWIERRKYKKGYLMELRGSGSEKIYQRYFW